jgi:hypothetical protein
MSGINKGTLDDPVNIVGIGPLLAIDNDELQSNINYDEIERDVITRGQSSKKAQHHKSAPELYRQDIDHIVRTAGGMKLFGNDENVSVVSGHSNIQKPTFNLPSKNKFNSPRNNIGNNNIGNNNITNNNNNDDDDDEEMSSVSKSQRSKNNGNQWGPPKFTGYYSTEDAPRHQHNQYTSNQNNQYTSNQNNQYTPKDNFASSKYYQAQTHEEKTQNIIQRVLGDGNNENNGIGFYSRGGFDSLNNHQSNKQLEDMIAKEQEEDLKAMLLSQIDLLTQSLKDEQIDMKRVPQVSEKSSLAEINAALRMLRYKNDSKRYINLAEDFVLLLAYGLETAFDGEKTYFGMQPDLSGWPDAVRHKITRMRPDTSAAVSQIMNGFNIGAWSRMALELVPSAFLYSRTRRSKNKSEVSDDEWKKSIHHMPTQ